MHVYNYIIEAKNRLTLLSVMWFSTFIVNYYYKEVLLFLFLELELFSMNELKIYYFIFTDAAEIFLVFIHLALFFSSQAFFLYFLYHCFIFSTPSLFLSEYYHAVHFFKISLSVWFFSVLFAKYAFIPATLDFFFNFQNAGSLNLYFEAKIKDYLDFYVKFYYIFIFYCQIFTFLVLLFNHAAFSVRASSKARKVNYFGAILFSTAISPPEIVSQIFVFFILIIFYEFFTFLFLFQYLKKELIRQAIKTDQNSNCKKKVPQS